MHVGIASSPSHAFPSASLSSLMLNFLSPLRDLPRHHTSVAAAPQEKVQPISSRLKTALRVDPLLAGDWNAVSCALALAIPPYPPTLEGCYRYLCDWVARIKPLYLMASTPSGFTYERARSSGRLIEEGATPDANALMEVMASLCGGVCADLEGRAARLVCAVASSFWVDV